MGARLAANVVLLGPDGTPACFPVGTSKSEVPDWAQEQMTNPAVWDGEDEKPAKADEPHDEPEAEPVHKPAARRTAAKK